MARCRASVLVGETLKPIEVVFSSGAQVSYISELTATKLEIPVQNEDVPITTRNVFDHTSTTTKFALIHLVLGTSQHMVPVLVLPGTLPHLVLGVEWLRKNRACIDSGQNTISFTVKHTIQLEEGNSDSVSILMPSLSIVSPPAPDVKTEYIPISRSKFIRDGWGNRVSFQASYGLSMSPEDLDEGTMILDRMMEIDREAHDDGAE